MELKGVYFSRTCFPDVICKTVPISLEDVTVNAVKLTS